MRNILNRAASLVSFQAWRALLTRGNSWFFVEGHLYIFNPEGTRRVQDSTGGHPFPGNNGQLFRRVGLNKSFTKSNRLSVMISGLGRFGNGIQQFLHSASFALITASSEILFFPNSTTVKRAGLEATRVHLRPLVSVFRRRKDAPQFIWRSDFFEAGLAIHAFDEQASAFLRPLLQQLYASLLDNDLVSDGVLTIHLRSGDIFGPNPHPGYGQPPLAFYKKIVNSGNWERVELVTEDSLNPCQEPLLSYLAERGIPASVTGDRLEAATRALSRARNLVASRGTFAPAILYLAETTKRVFVFNGEIDRIPAGPLHSYHPVTDLSGVYTAAALDSNWKNSASQRKIMLDYPEASLSMSSML